MTTTRSMFKSLWLPFFGVALASWGVYRAGATASLPPQAPPPAVIGLVNMEKLMAGLNELKTRSEERQATVDKQNKELGEYEKRLVALSEELKLLKAHSDEWRAKTSDAILIQSEGKAKKQIYTELNDLNNGAAMAAIYTKATAAIGKVAAKDGYALVLLDDRPLPLPNPQTATGEKVIATIMNKRILYGAESLDITDRVITEMNNEWSAPAPRGQK